MDFIFKPDAPTGLEVESDSIAHDSVKLKWVAGASNGAQIKSYLVEYGPDQSNLKSVDTKSATTEYTLSGLSSQTDYLV